MSVLRTALAISSISGRVNSLEFERVLPLAVLSSTKAFFSEGPVAVMPTDQLIPDLRSSKMTRRI